MPGTALRPLLLVTSVSSLGYFLSVLSPAETHIPSICGAIGTIALQDVPLVLGPGFSLATALVGWSFMVAAMMSPLVLRPLLAISAARRGQWSLAAFLMAYISIWLVMAFWIVPLAILMLLWAGRVAAIMFTLLIALAWSMSPLCQHFRNECHRADWRAGAARHPPLDHVREGLRYGLFCCGTCWPWMVLGTFLETSHVVSMAIISGFLFAERAFPPTVARWQIVPLLQLAFERLRPQKVLGRP